MHDSCTSRAGELPGIPFAPPAFIVGVPRSGTTLISAILNRHSRVCVTPETHYYVQFPGAVSDEQSLATAWPSVARRGLFAIEGMTEMGISAQDVLTAADQRRTRAGLISAIGELYAEKCGKRLWVEKTPQHLLRLPEIWRDFPDARIVHILRDGRDVALSLSKVDWANPGFLHNLYRWTIELDIAARDTADPRCFTIRYEDLLASPAETVASVCGFLGITFEERMLEPDGSEDALIETGMTHKDNISRPILAGNQGKWVQAVSPELATAADQLFGETLARYGYQRHKVAGASASSGEILMPRSLFFRENPRDVRYAALSDRDAEYLVRSGWSIRLAEKSSCLLDTNEATRCVICSSEVPEFGTRPRALWWRLSFVYELRQRLRALLRRGVKILWLKRRRGYTAGKKFDQRIADLSFDKGAYAEVKFPQDKGPGIAIGGAAFYAAIDEALAPCRQQ